MKESVKIKKVQVKNEVKIDKKYFSVNKSIIIILIILLGASLGAGFYFYKKSINNTPKDTQKELQDTIKIIGKLMVLPTDETPTLATVNDPEKLKNQAFFANAKVGDKVLIYTNAKKAILYNPAQNKIVEVSPLNINQ